MAGLMAACASKQPTQTTAQAPAAEGAPAAASWEPPPLPTDGAIGLLGLTGPDKPFGSMTDEEQEWYMIGKVHPVMRQVFQTYDKDRYEGLKFECTPCHQPNPEVTKYKMPNPKLSPIPAFGSEDWKAMENARIVKFMKARVTPVMAQLLGHDPNDASAGDAVTCYACHPKQ
jgi:hypothetical protein